MQLFGYSFNYFEPCTAVAGSDYVERSNVMLTFNAATRRIEVSVDLIDDNEFEGEEDFSGTLTLVSDSQRVAIDHGSVVATIVDDESGQNITVKIESVIQRKNYVPRNVAIIKQVYMQRYCTHFTLIQCSQLS